MLKPYSLLLARHKPFSLASLGLPQDDFFRSEDTGTSLLTTEVCRGREGGRDPKGSVQCGCRGPQTAGGTSGATAAIHWPRPAVQTAHCPLKSTCQTFPGTHLPPHNTGAPVRGSPVQACVLCGASDRQDRQRKQCARVGTRLVCPVLCTSLVLLWMSSVYSLWSFCVCPYSTVG